MAGRFNSSLRAVQKKLKKIVKDVAKSEGFESILESIDESDPILEFMFEEEALEQFGDNVHAFKAAADNAWIHCAKSSGLKEAAEQVSTICTNLLRQEFPEMEFEDVQVTKKRGRASVEKAPVGSPTTDKSPPKKRTAIKEEASSTAKKKKAAAVEEVEEEPEVTITTADKATLKAIITKLSKSEDAEYFLYAVDAEAYPEYYEQIAYPMDLNTAKNKLTSNEYYSVSEALADLRIIWENCRQFNAEGSDILNMAENCSALLESLVEEKFPSEVLPKKGKGGRKPKVASNTVEEAPATAVKAEKNTSASSVAPASGKKAPSSASAKRKRANSTNTIVQAGWPVTPRTLQPVSEHLVLTRSVMKSVLREVANSEYADPFLDPVDLDEAPGYAELIAQPMDLTTLRKRITMGLYDHSAAAFVKDVRLVWENCVKYNDPESDIALFAAQLGEHFEAQLGTVLEQMDEEHSTGVAAAALEVVEAAPHSAAKGKPGRKPKAVEEDAQEEAETKPAPRKNSIGAHSNTNHTTSSTSAADDAEADAKKPASATVKKMRKILREIYKIDLSLPFQEPVPVDEVPGYSDIISNPMDLSTVKAQLHLYDDAPGKFLRDMRLIFDNCQKFNLESSELYKNAGILRDTVDKLYCEAFPPVDAAEEAAAAQRAAQKAARKNKASDNSHSNAAQSDSVNEEYRPRAAGATYDTHSNGKKFGEVPLTASATYINTSMSTAVPALPAPPSSGTSAAALSARLPTNPVELEMLEKSLSDPSVAPSTNTYVRDRAALKARDKWKSTKFPYIVAPDLYVVHSLGELQGTFDKYPDHDATHLYPLGYSVSRKMRIALHSKDRIANSDGGNGEGTTKVMPFIDVDLKCKIALSYAGNPDIFHVMLENGTAISQGASAHEAWRGILGKELPILHSLGGKLKRCRAVFNRLAVSPDALPFLEMVPHTGPLGEHYYNVIKSPMWFREVHSRLVEGTYDVEFDFAWDMRLIFKNCMEYNLAGSELYQAAQRLGEAFEQLFTRWVLNVQDNSITDTAKGTWDAWSGLKFFDFEDPTVNICAVTGTRGPASQMLQCKCCEDQNLATLHPTVTNKNDWACPRCVEALAWCDNDLTNSPFCTYISPIARYDPYNIEEFGGNAYLPSPEFGQGWSQAKRRLGTGVKNLYLSPLGYEVLREQIPDQAAYENIVNTNLYAARAVEFTEYAKNLLQPRGSSKRKTARHKRNASEPMSPEKANGQASSAAAPTVDPAAILADEEGRIPTGKLHNFTVPDDAQLVWLTCSNESLVLEKAAAGQDITSILSDRVQLTATLLPETGFFGLHLPVIRARLEGIPGAISCADYRFQDEEKHRDDILKEVRNIRKRQELLMASDNTLKRVLLEERHRFDKLLLTPPLPPASDSKATVSTASMEHKKDFYPLFPPTLQTHQADALLCLWEFLYLTPSLAKHIEVYSLHDLVCSLTPPSTAVTTYGQVVFDEVCCSLAEVMLSDLRLRCDMTFRVEVKWQQEVLMVRPVNILTWPEVALESLRLINFPLSVDEMGKTLTAPVLPSMQLLQRDLLTLVFNHPLIDTFLVQTPVLEGHVGPDPNVITFELRKMKEHFSDSARILTDTEGIYASVESLCAGLRQLFVDIAATDVDSNSRRVLHARSIVRWFDELLTRWSIILADVPALPEDFPSMDMLTPALHAEKLNPWRFWGGYTLSNVDLPRTQLLLPSDLNRQELSDYARRVKALNDLEKTLWLLGRSEPETWTADERTTIYLTFIDHCIVSKEFITAANQRQSWVNTRLVRTTDIPSAPAGHVPHLDVVKHSPAGTKCHFTGVEVDHSLEGAVWVSVPAAYQNIPGSTSDAAAVVGSGSSQGHNSAGGRGTRGSTAGCVALQSALLSVMAAREAAVNSERIYEQRVSSVLKTSLFEPAKTTLLQKQIRFLNDPLRSASVPSQPLGYDRLGNAYWLLSVQEASTLFPFHPNGAPLFMPGVASAGLTDGKISAEPCVLMREPSGWWGVHNFAEITPLLLSFSLDLLCERTLQLRLIEKLAYTRCFLARHALNIRVTQREWIVKRIRAEHAVHGVKLPAEPLAPLQMTRFLETVWARCVEVRQYLHICSAYRFEEDYMVNSLRAEKDLQNKRTKRLRELVGDDVFQLHHQKGWLRNDFLARLRQTAATTTATQIVADGSFYPQLAENSRKAPFLLRNDPMAPPLSVTRAPLLLADAPAAAASGAMEVSEDPVNSTPGASAAPVLKPSEVTESTSMDVEVVPDVSTTTVLASEKEAESMAKSADAEEKSSEPMEVEETGKTSVAITATVPASIPTPAVESDGAALKEEVRSSDDTNQIATKPEVAKTETTEQAPVDDPKSHLLDPNSLIPDLRAFINERCHVSSDAFKTKVIEVVHMYSGELIRVFLAGKDAATFFGVSQSGISLCLHNTKPDYYGFKWRLYDGPLISCWPELEQVQLPLSAVLQYQIKGKGGRESWDPVEERARVIRAVMEAKKLDPALYKKMPTEVPTPTLAYVFKPAAAPAATPTPAPSAHQAPNLGQQNQNIRSVAALTLPPRPAAPMPPAAVPKPASFLHAQHVVLSNEVVSARLLRLKAELLNIFYIMPEKTLRLPELDEAGEKAIADAGAEAANNIRNGIAKLSAAKPAAPMAEAPEASAAPVAAEKDDEKVEGTSAPTAETVAPTPAPAATESTSGNNSMDMTMSNVDRLADKAARKAKRRLRRKLSMEKFIKDIQEATTPQQLLEVTIILEGAIPQGTMYKYNRASLPMDAVTMATLARRVFALDRAIAYDEIKGVENNVNTVPVRLRYQFYPRCFMSASCSKFCGHAGKCISINDNGSRIPDFQDVQFNRAPGVQPYQYQAPANRPLYGSNNNNNMAAQLALANQRKAAYLQQLAALRPKDEDLPLEEIINKLLQVRKELDIENITPYCPPAAAVTEFEWI